MKFLKKLSPVKCLVFALVFTLIFTALSSAILHDWATSAFRTWNCDGGRQQGVARVYKPDSATAESPGASCRVHTRPYSEQKRAMPSTAWSWHAAALW